MNPALVVSDPNLELIDQHSFASAERRYAFRARAGGVTDGLNMRAGNVLVIDLPSSATLRAAARIVRRPIEHKVQSTEYKEQSTKRCNSRASSARW